MGLSCIGNATAVKLGEDNEQIPVIAGTFMDEFANGKPHTSTASTEEHAADCNRVARTAGRSAA